MQTILIVLLMLAFGACQHRQRPVMTAPPKEVILELGCSAKTKNC